MAGAKPSTPSLTHMAPTYHRVTCIIDRVAHQCLCAQTYLHTMSELPYDGGCYVLTKEDYNRPLHYTNARNQMIEELQIILAQTEAELHHITRLIEDNILSSNQNNETGQLQERLIQLVQLFTGIKKQHYNYAYEVNPCPELQYIYQKRLSSRTWKPHPIPNRTRSCPSFRLQRCTPRALLPFTHVQLRRGFSPIFEPDSD